MDKSHPYTIQLALISLLLFVLIFKWIHYLSTNNYVRYNEGMVNNGDNNNNDDTLYLSFSTTYST